MKKLWKTGLISLFFFLSIIGMTAITPPQAVMASSFDNAVTFYNTYGSDIVFKDGYFYYGMRGKAASASVNTTHWGRFIDSSYYLKSYENGGLESTSKWKSEVTYKDTLEAAMYNVKGEDGNWSHTVQIWEFSKEDIEQVKYYVNNYGMGNSKYQYNIKEFLDIFKANKNY